MRDVHVVYRPKGPGWEATSPDAPDYVAYGDTLAEVIVLAHEGMAFHFDVEPCELAIIDFVNSPPGVVLANNTTGLFGVTVSGAYAATLNVGELVVPGGPTPVPENVKAEVHPAPLSAA